MSMSYYYFLFYTLLYMFLHSFLAHDSVKAFFYRHIIKEKYYRFFFVSYATLMLIPIGYFYFKAEKHNFYTPSYIHFTIGGILIIVSLYIFYISFKNYNIKEFIGLDRLQNKEKPFYPLKIEGINAYMRHPLYSASYLLMAGIFLILPDVYILTACIIIAIYLPIGILFEEQKLKKEYGKDYIEYIKNVPMLIPRIKPKR